MLLFLELSDHQELDRQKVVEQLADRSCLLQRSLSCVPQVTLEHHLHQRQLELGRVKPFRQVTLDLDQLALHQLGLANDVRAQLTNLHRPVRQLRKKLQLQHLLVQLSPHLLWSFR